MNLKDNYSFYNLITKIEKFTEINILVIGDIMLDNFLYGSTKRVSPEAPVPIVNINNEENILGGAANVAKNIKKLKGKVSLIGTIGDDKNGKIITKLLKNNKIEDYTIINKKIKTITKKRIINDTYQITRLDIEDNNSLYFEKSLLINLKNNFNKYDLVILSDYNKGVVTNELCNFLLSLSRKYNTKVIVDPKGKNYNKYKNFYLITPNFTEFNEIIKEYKFNKKPRSNGSDLIKKFNINNLIVTKGSDGIELYNKKNLVAKIKSNKIQLADVTGAGDTFIASIAMFLAVGCDIKSSANFANKVAGIVVQKKGTSFVNLHEIIYNFTRQKKFIDINLLSNFYLNEKHNKKIVFTNGCFDILHAGHISLFKEAKKHGDILILALNSDISIRKIKGLSRPINNLEDRLKILEAISYIDFIVSFDEITPLKLIKKIKPSVLIKGGDYQKKNIIGYNFVNSYGGKVIISKYLKGYSSSNVINKLIK